MKLGSLPILCIGGAIGAICWGWGYFRFWMPNLDTAAKHSEAANKWETEAKDYPTAVKNYEGAVAMIQAEQAKWQEIVKVKTPPSNLAAGGIDLGVNAWQLVNDTFTFRNSIQRAVNRQVKVGGVKAVGPAIELPPVEASRIMSDFYNYPAVPYPVVMWNLGQVQVRGTYDQIMTNARAWKNMPNYLAMSDGLQIQGTGDILTASYNVVIVGYLRGDKLYPTVLEGASPGTGTPGGGGQQRRRQGGGQ